MVLLLLARLASALDPATSADLGGPKDWLGGEWMIVPGDRSAHDQEHDLLLVWELMPRFGAARFTGADKRVELLRDDAACGVALNEAAVNAQRLAQLSMRAPTEVVARRFRWMEGKACSFEIDVLLAASGDYASVD